MIPVNLSSSNIGAHVSDDNHALWDNMPWEVLLSKLKTMDRLIDAHMEVRCFWIDLPGCWIWHLGMVRVRRVGDLDQVFGRNELSCLSNTLLRPQAGGKIHSLFSWLESNEVLDNGGVLHGGTTLVKHDGIVLRNIQEISDIFLAFIRDLDKLWLSVTEFHDTLH